MDGNELWISLVTTVVVPILLKVLTHYFPWLADAVTPGTAQALADQKKPEPEKGVYDIETDGETS